MMLYIKNNIKKITALLLAAVIICKLTSCSESGTERDVATCKGCGRSFYAGDANGNYMNIAWTNLCNKCEAEVKAYQELKDYIELNGK